VNQICESVINGCLANGPQINCPEDVPLLTSTLCGGGQCAVAPSPPSVICNDYQQCGCSVQLSSSHPPGDLLAAGTHAFQFEATNDNGFSRTCSYDVIVDNQCNPNGPSLNCPEGDIFIGTDFQCSQAFGRPCAYFSREGEYASCSDFEGCNCQVHFGPGSPDDGQVIFASRPPTATFYATNAVGIESSYECAARIVVTEG